MRKVLFLIATFFMFATIASANQGLPDRVTTLEQQVGELQSQPTPTNGVDGAQGIAGTNGINGNNGLNGTNGIDGINAQNDELYSLLSQTASAQAAIGSVELNPDHVGFSVGVGVSNREGDAAGAVGIMYGVKYDTGIIKTVGYNAKFYNAEGGFRGATAGLTIGFQPMTSSGVTIGDKMKREDVLKKIEPLLDSAIELAESDDMDKITGAVVRLNAKMAKNDVDAFVELAMISILMDDKAKK